MKLWKRAAGALKDQSSILAASLSRWSPHRNPDLEAAIINATSHDEDRVDYRNAQRVFSWIRTYPVSLKPLIRALSTRMEKTQSWVVAIKGLMLMHGVFCCKTPAVQRIGRMPFDLSNFEDGHSHPEKMWAFNAFVRAYFAFLDHRSAFLYEQRKQKEEPMVQELVRLQNWQTLIDLLLHMKPLDDNLRYSRLILEAMDCVIIEIFDIYSRICNGIARILLGIYSVGKLEATMALKVLQKATTQGKDLALYFDFCKEMGVFNAMEVPKVAQIKEEDIRDLKRIINGLTGRNNLLPEDEDNIKKSKVGLQKKDGSKQVGGGLKTIITEKWEVFDDQDVMVTRDGCGHDQLCNFRAGCSTVNPYECPPPSYQGGLPIVPVHHRPDIPDLISSSPLSNHNVLPIVPVRHKPDIPDLISFE